jgi:hypothetical protein
MTSAETKHPGKIVFIDGNTQQITHEFEAAEVPFNIRFVELEGQLVPVVKIVAFTSAQQRTIRQYGPEGQLLNSTLQSR